ncbi:MAG: GDSL-type esterase/lipase family protein [Kibdelosporangium sp.]
MRRKTLLTLVTVLGLVVAPAVASAGPAGGWEGTWAASPQAAGEVFGPNWSVGGFADQTVRQIVRTSQGGPAVRIRLSNQYGSSPLQVTGATVARTGEGASVRPGSVRQVTFGHARSTVIPAGREIASDAVGLVLRPLEKLSVTLYFAKPTGPVTYHGDAERTSYRAAGDHRSDTSGAAFTETSTSWYLLSELEVVDLSPHRDVVAAFGDSITDGALGGVDIDARYPDALAERLNGRRGVLNTGIGGNRVLNDSACFGARAIDRFKADVLSQPHLRTVIILEGINDIGSSELEFDCFKPNPRVTAAELIAGHRELIKQARSAGVRAVGATLLPYKGAMYYTERGESVRDELNTWIRTSGEYDAVVDFDRAMADPADADALNPAYDSGDKLHPNAAGYRAMAAAVDLRSL